MPPSSLRPRNSDAQRCGHLWSMTPTRPGLSRNAISCSPSSRRRMGAPSGLSSDDIAAGSQYSRINLPIVVPGPMRTRSSLSFWRMGFAPSKSKYQRRSPWPPLARGRRMKGSAGCSNSRPEGEAEAGARPGGRAVARLVMRPFEREVLDGAADANPVADFRAAGIEQLARQVLDRVGVLAPEHLDEAAVERLVDDEMRETTRCDDADPLIAGHAFDRLADRLAELVAAPRRRLVWRVVGVDADRHDRHHVLHDPLVEEPYRVALPCAVGERVRGCQDEFAVIHLCGRMAGERGVDGVVGRYGFFVPA